VPVRRSRGYAPLPVRLPEPIPEALLAVGGDLKNTFCLAEGQYAWLSAHLGDMDDLASQRAFAGAVDQLAALVQVRPRLLVADHHPAYRSTQWARRTVGIARAAGLPQRLVQVQHHHAHLAAVAAEHGLTAADRVIGFALDGTGYGEDGAVWGGEVLISSYRGFERFAHLSYVSLAGGDAAVRRPYRMALAHLNAAGVAWDPALPCVAACPPAELVVLANQLRTRVACVSTSSTGRLFDAVASLTGLCHQVGFDAQAAMALETAATGVEADRGYPLPLRPTAEGNDTTPFVLDCAELVRAVADDVRRGAGPGQVAARFHRGLVEAVVETAVTARERTGLQRGRCPAGCSSTPSCSARPSPAWRNAASRF
jgi:hydrogenase maturation protein HypF